MAEIKKTESSAKPVAAIKTPVAADEKKTEVKAEAKKPAAKKTAAKKTETKAAEVEPKVSIELQYSYKHIPYDELVQNSKNNFQYEMGGNVDEIKKLSIYVKPSEDAAYYVVNDKVQGRIGL